MSSSAPPSTRAVDSPPAAAERPQREERKYPLAEGRVELLAAWIGARIAPDPEYPRGVITSCYYDSASLDAYWDAADGFWGKAKLRLRWYGQPVAAEDGCWLEIKQREGATGRKLRLHLDVEQGQVLTEGVRLPGRGQLADGLRELGAPAAPTLEPTVVIRYERRRWADAASGLRVSIDARVRAGEPRRGLTWLAVPDGAVLELKSTGPLPARLRGLERLGLRREAHSKYAMAVERTLPRIWRGGV